MPQASSLKPFPQLRSALRRWFQRNSRKLPWRGTRDPYEIWISEIMLQQTTTRAVERHYRRFLERFPNVEALANAELSEVYRSWEGLGYYRRAKQMHTAANIIVHQYGGKIPNDYFTVHALPGIGRYTAGAILSIAFDQRLPILEANTIRLHLRLLALKSAPNEAETNRTLWKFAEDVLPRKNVGEFNQALMDLGSCICVPNEPLCESRQISNGNLFDIFEEETPSCPLTPFCEAFRLKLQREIPIPAKKPTVEKTTEIAFLVQKRKRILVLQYPEGTRWSGLWDFPRCQAQSMDDPTIPRSLEKISGRKLTPFFPAHSLITLKHTVTRFKITLHFLQAEDSGVIKSTKDAYPSRWVTLSQLADLPTHSSGRQLIEFLLQREEIE